MFRRAIDAAVLQARYVPALAALPSRRSPACCWSAATRSSTASSRWARSSRSTAYLLLLVCRCARSACGSASTSGRWPRASGSSRCWTSERDMVEAAGAQPLPDGPGADPLRAASVRLRRRPHRCCTMSTWTVAAGQHDRPDRPHRLRQDDADDADPPLLRRRPRAGCWWTGWTSATSRSSRCAARSGSSARTPSCSRPRWPRTSPTAGPTPRPSRSSRRPAGPGARVHLDLPDGYETHGGRARAVALGRPAAADRDRPRAADEPARADPGRRHRLGRRRHRGPHQARPARGDAAAARP